MRTFYPRKTISIAASAPHPNNTEYKISVGDEEWGSGEFHTVIKVQMSYGGKIAGRKSPSYPIGSDDYLNVCDAIRKLISET